MLKLKEVDEKRVKGANVLLKALEEDRLSVEEAKVLRECLENLQELTDYFDYLGNEALKLAEKRKERN